MSDAAFQLLTILASVASVYCRPGSEKKVHPFLTVFCSFVDLGPFSLSDIARYGGFLVYKGKWFRLNLCPIFEFRWAKT